MKNTIANKEYTTLLGDKRFKIMEGNLVSVIDAKDISANELEKLYLQTV